MKGGSNGGIRSAAQFRVLDRLRRGDLLREADLDELRFFERLGERESLRRRLKKFFLKKI